MTEGIMVSRGVVGVPEPGAIGRNVKALRERHGLSQNALARRSGVSQAFLSRLEAGERQEVGSSALRSLARALQVTVDDLLREDAHANEGSA
jgi:transcriptional regulator with XRE-family HTH domain